MKKILVILCLCVSTTAFAAPGDTLSDRQNAIFQLAASPGYTGALLSAMNAVGQSYIEQDSLAHWMQVYTAINGLSLYNPLNVYYSYLEYTEGYKYGRSRLTAEAEPPGSPTVDGSTVTCLIDATGQNRRPDLYEWNYVIFTESDIVGTLSDGVWTFAGVPAGLYVLAFESASLPTLYLTVN